MAKSMPFTDASGNDYQASYWKVVHIHMDIAGNSGSVILYGYKSRAASKSGKAPLPGAVRQYTITPQMYALIAPKLLPVVGKVAYEDVVNQIKDVPAPTTENPDAMKGFFEGATDEVD